MLIEIRKTVGLNLNRWSGGEEAEKIDEVTNLTQDPSSPLLGIVHPMIWRNGSRVHPVEHGYRFFDFANKSNQAHRHRRKTPIESHHQQRPFQAPRVQAHNFCKL